MQWFSRNFRFPRFFRSALSSRAARPPSAAWGETSGSGSSLVSFPSVGARLPINLLRKGKVAVRPSSSSSSLPLAASLKAPERLPSRPSMLSAPSKADIISLVRPSSSSSLRPIFSIISVTGRMFSSRAHFKQRPSLWLPCPLLSSRVMNTTATFFLHLLQRVGFIGAFTPPWGVWFTSMLS